MTAPHRCRNQVDTNLTRLPSSSHPAPGIVHEAFQRFPAPLAIADAAQGLLQANEAWLRRFGRAVLAVSDVDLAGNGERILVLRVPGTGELREVHARAVSIPGCVVLVVGGPAEPSPDGLVEALRARLAVLERLASTDHLTGAWNRAHFDRVIGLELERSRTDRSALSLVLLDVDHFKRINDGFGHAAGDAVLRELSGLLQARIRPSDLLFRWGGEEFAVLVSSAGWRGAERVARKLREAVEAHRFAHGQPVTVSAGVAERASGESARAWFSRLDAALYAAKDQGRNRVVVDRRGQSDERNAANTASVRLEWREAYECGDEAIDGEHRELFSQANRLLDAALDPARSGAARLAILDEFLGQVAIHFEHEEALLARHGYAGLEAHRDAHAGLLRRAAWLRERVQAGEAGLGALVEFVVQDVVARHLLTVDRAFFPLFAQS